MGCGESTAGTPGYAGLLTSKSSIPSRLHRAADVGLALRSGYFRTIRSAAPLLRRASVGFGVVGVALTYKRTKRRKARFDAAYI